MTPMMVALALTAMVQADLLHHDEYEYAPEQPFKLAGLLISLQTLHTDFEPDLGLDDGDGMMFEAHLRIGEIYYYRIAGCWWDTEEDLPGGRDVDIRAGVLGMGMDWLFGAFPNISLDGGAGIGLIEVDSGIRSDEGFYFQIEGALSVRPVPHIGFRFSLFGDYTNLRFNTPRTEHGLNLSVGAGLELKF